MVSLYVFNFWLAACLLEGASSIAFSNTVFDDIAIGSNWTFSWVQANGPVVLTLKQGVGTDSENAVKTIIDGETSSQFLWYLHPTADPRTYVGAYQIEIKYTVTREYSPKFEIVATATKAPVNQTVSSSATIVTFSTPISTTTSLPPSIPTSTPLSIATTLSQTKFTHLPAKTSIAVGAALGALPFIALLVLLFYIGRRTAAARVRREENKRSASGEPEMDGKGKEIIELNGEHNLVELESGKQATEGEGREVIVEVIEIDGSAERAELEER